MWMVTTDLQPHFKIMDGQHCAVARMVLSFDPIYFYVCMICKDVDHKRLTRGNFEEARQSSTHANDSPTQEFKTNF